MSNVKDCFLSGSTGIVNVAFIKKLLYNDNRHEMEITIINFFISVGIISLTWRTL